MGTSASSNGPGFGVSLDPPWLDDIEPEPEFENHNNPDLKDNELLDDEQIPHIAPKARFAKARRNMGEYVHSGSKESLRRSLGHYSKTGMGGAKSLSRRMRVSAKVGSNLWRTFHELRDNPDFELGKVLSELKAKGANAANIISIIVKEVCPRGGSLDEMSSINSATAALSEYLDRYPELDITNLSDDQMWELTGTYLVNEIFSRIQLDIGQSFETADIPFPDRINRMNDMKDFIQVDVSIQLNKIRETEAQTFNVQNLLQKTIQRTFEIYEVEV